jgi:signal transduction histidine kinase
VDGSSMVGVTQDVTERKRAEQQLAEMTRRKDLFIATLGHELRQPLTPMVTALALMRAHPDQDAVDRARHVVERQVNQLTRLVDDLIDSARIAQGKVEIHCLPMDLRDAVKDAVDVAAPLFAARRQQFQLDMPEVVMPVLADRDRLQQIFSNILVNATKYTDDHGVITLSATATEREARIVVRDSGRGIAANHLPWIFDMFMQASTETGLGIGLPVVRRLVEMHGGQVEVRSDGPGCGSEFVVSLPLAEMGSPV